MRFKRSANLQTKIFRGNLCKMNHDNGYHLSTESAFVSVTYYACVCFCLGGGLCACVQYFNKTTRVATLGFRRRYPFRD